LPLDPQRAAARGFGEATCALLTRVAALPELVSRHGWPKPLRLPPMLQLGYYQPGSGAHYQPHLDRQPNEEGNARELTFLVYLSPRYERGHGGCLRLLPGACDGEGAAAVEVEPLSGRVVVFRSADQMHAVEECHEGMRLALSMWVEYGEEELEEEAGRGDGGGGGDEGSQAP
jgi:hypothetical protein